MIATYTVAGMTCEHCVNAMKKEVGAIPGVESVELELDGKLVVHSDAPIDFDRLVEAASEAGDYTVS